MFDLDDENMYYENMCNKNSTSGNFHNSLGIILVLSIIYIVFK